MTRFSVVDEDDWVVVPDEEVMQHAPLYDGPHQPARLIEDLGEYPLRDESGRINQVYNAAGNRVPRMTPAPDAVYRRCGVLYDLKAVRRVFSGQDPLPPGIHGDQHTQEDREPVEHYLYPHCYTTSIGQWQAKGVYPSLHHTVREVNEQICAEFEAIPVEPTRRRAVWPVSSQGYNLLAYTTFSNLEDVKYYDEKCEAHQGLKDLAKGKIQPPPFVVMWETS